MTRNAAGQFAPAERSASDRQQLLPSEIKRVEKQIDDAMLAKREILRRDGAASVAAVRARRELADLSALRLDLIEEAKLLEPIAGREQQAARKVLPTTREQALARLQALEPRLVQLDSIPWNARHAGLQAELDMLRQQQYYFTGLVRTLPSEAALAKESL